MHTCMHTLTTMSSYQHILSHTRCAHYRRRRVCSLCLYHIRYIRYHYIDGRLTPPTLSTYTLLLSLRTSQSNNILRKTNILIYIMGRTEEVVTSQSAQPSMTESIHYIVKIILDHIVCTCSIYSYKGLTCSRWRHCLQSTRSRCLS